MHPLLRQLDHRTAPLPARPWIMAQRWHDLLFAHWPLSPDVIRPLLPRQLELDVRDGQAWVGVVPFWMSGIRLRFLPPLPGLSTTPELNVRTYVTHGGVPGVYFFSLDCASRAAVRSARTFYHLPYFDAAMSIRNIEGAFHYQSARLEKPGPAEFQGRYWPTSSPAIRSKGSLESFLTDRYCLYTTHQRQVFRAYIHHPPWPLQDAEADIKVNTVAHASGIELPEKKPLLHFSLALEVLVWPPEQV